MEFFETTLKTSEEDENIEIIRQVQKRKFLQSSPVSSEEDLGGNIDLVSDVNVNDVDFLTSLEIAEMMTDFENLFESTETTLETSEEDRAKRQKVSDFSSPSLETSED